MVKIDVTPTWQSPAKNARSGFIGGLTNAATPLPLKQVLLPRSLDLNVSFQLKYRR